MFKFQHHPEAAEWTDTYDKFFLENLTAMNDLRDSKDMVVNWSADDRTPFTIYEPLPLEMRYKPITLILEWYDRDDDFKENITTATVEVNTYLDLWQAIDKLYKSTNDWHYFFEGLERRGNDTYNLVMGS